MSPWIVAVRALRRPLFRRMWRGRWSPPYPAFEVQKARILRDMNRIERKARPRGIYASLQEAWEAAPDHGNVFCHADGTFTVSGPIGYPYPGVEGEPRL